MKKVHVFLNEINDCLEREKRVCVIVFPRFDMLFRHYY